MSVTVQSGQWEIDQGNKVAASILNAHPDIKAILRPAMTTWRWAPWPPSAPLARPARCNWSVTTTSNAIKPMLKDGRVLATVDQFAQQQAVFGIETALKAVTEKKPQSALGGVVETKVSLVTK